MVTIIGYAYDAAMHCPVCAQVDYVNGVIRGDRHDTQFAHDQYNLPERMVDREHNPVHPVFSTDEEGEGGDHCDRCHTNLRTGEVPLAWRQRVAREGVPFRF